MALQDQQDHKAADLQAQPVLRAHLARFKALQGLQALLLLDQLALRVRHLLKLALRALQDRQAQLVRKEIRLLGLQDHKAYRAYKEYRAKLDLLAHREILALLALLEMLDLLEMLGLLAVRATLDLQGLRARIPQLQGRQALLVQLVRKVAHQRLQGLLAHKVFRAYRAKLARLAQQGLQERKEIVLLAQQDQLAHKETKLLDLQALQAQLDLLALIPQ